MISTLVFRRCSIYHFNRFTGCQAVTCDGCSVPFKAWALWNIFCSETVEASTLILISPVVGRLIHWSRSYHGSREHLQLVSIMITAFATTNWQEIRQRRQGKIIYSEWISWKGQNTTVCIQIMGDITILPRIFYYVVYTFLVTYLEAYGKEMESLS